RADTPEQLLDEVYVPARQGTLRTEIRAAVRSRELVPVPLQPELDAVLREVAAGRPVLVMQNLLFDWFPQWHFAVVVGYDLEAGHVILRSGRERRRITPLATFERTWQRSGRWAQVIVPPDELPATAEPLRWLQVVNELEQTGNRTAAMTGYRTATQRWPGTIEAWLARGNAAYAADDPDAARDAFTEAVLRAPRRSAGWNNLAYALAATGCGTAARAAARCAVALSPDDPGPKDTLEEIGSMTVTGYGDRCELPACPVDTSGAQD
ncbi:MAG: PA2778 family cysteine peptidase, partial [Halofilum sp. (in: g-proteobacteria)]|nr:PA2778 family cysteine peptidase [Halofilum sp. (in: g-proteobacteria)]